MRSIQWMGLSFFGIVLVDGLSWFLLIPQTVCESGTDCYSIMNYTSGFVVEHNEKIVIPKLNTDLQAFDAFDQQLRLTVDCKDCMDDQQFRWMLTGESALQVNGQSLDPGDSIVVTQHAEVRLAAHDAGDRTFIVSPVGF